MLVVARYNWVVPKPCACSTPMWVQGLFVVHVFAMACGLIWSFCASCYLFLTLYGVDDHWVFILCISFLPWAGLCLGMGSFLLQSSPYLLCGSATLLPCHPIASVMLLFDLCLLGLFSAYRTLSLYLVHVAQYFCWASSHIILGFLGPFHPFRASSAHFISLGILGPFYYYIHMAFC